MVTAQIVQGTWDEIVAQAKPFVDRKDLTLIIPGEVNQQSVISKVASEALQQSEAQRIEAIQSAYGMFKYSGVASEELRLERKRDNEFGNK